MTYVTAGPMQIDESQLKVMQTAIERQEIDSTMQSSGLSAKLQLSLGTGAFALCFAVFGSLSAMMPILSRQMHLTPVQKSVAVAVPVLLGSLGRIPLGML